MRNRKYRRMKFHVFIKFPDEYLDIDENESDYDYYSSKDVNERIDYETRYDDCVVLGI